MTARRKLYSEMLLHGMDITWHHEYYVLFTIQYSTVQYILYNIMVIMEMDGTICVRSIRHSVRSLVVFVA